MIAVGVGCRAACPVSDIVGVVTDSLSSHGCELGEVQAVYSAAFKAGAENLERAAAELGKPLVLLSSESLAGQAHAVLTFSAQVAARFNLPALAETAALAGAFELAGKKGAAQLLGARRARGGATCALARVPELSIRSEP